MTYNTRRPFFRSVKKILKLFIKAPETTFYGDEMPSKAIFISNHVGSTGPLKHELYLDYPVYFWGTYEMCLDVRGRWDYLKNIYYGKKHGYGKVHAFLAALVALPVTSAFYKGIQVIPTYRDVRLMGTMKTSLNYLKSDYSILVFPEDSSTGYHDELIKYFCGFVVLAKLYRRSIKEDVPIVNMYYCKQTNRLAIDRPRYLSEFEGKTDDEIAEFFKNRANEMGRDLREPK